MKGNEEVSRSRVNGIIGSVQVIETAREGVGVSMKDEWHSAVIDFECISFRTIWIQFKF